MASFLILDPMCVSVLYIVLSCLQSCDPPGLLSSGKDQENHVSIIKSMVFLLPLILNRQRGEEDEVKMGGDEIALVEGGEIREAGKRDRQKGSKDHRKKKEPGR